jgi:hypothetical protein
MGCPPRMRNVLRATLGCEIQSRWRKCQIPLLADCSEVAQVGASNNFKLHRRAGLRWKRLESGRSCRGGDK